MIFHKAFAFTYLIKVNKFSQQTSSSCVFLQQIHLTKCHIFLHYTSLLSSPGQIWYMHANLQDRLWVCLGFIPLFPNAHLIFSITLFRPPLNLAQANVHSAKLGMTALIKPLYTIQQCKDSPSALKELQARRVQAECCIPEGECVNNSVGWFSFEKICNAL